MCKEYIFNTIYLYVRGTVRIIMPVYVDDITFVSNDKPAIAKAILHTLTFEILVLQATC